MDESTNTSALAQQSVPQVDHNAVSFFPNCYNFLSLKAIEPNRVIWISGLPQPYSDYQCIITSSNIGWNGQSPIIRLGSRFEHHWFVLAGVIVLTSRVMHKTRANPNFKCT